MARVGAGADMAKSINGLGSNLLAWQLRRDALKKQEQDEILRREVMNQDNARWTAQDTYRREQDGVRQGEAADRTRREDERWNYTKEQDAYKNKQDELRYEIGQLDRKERAAADDAYKYESLKEKYQAEANGAGTRDYKPQPFSIDLDGKKVSGIYNPSTGAFEMPKPEKGPTVRITERDPLGTLSVSRTIGLDEYEKQQAAKNPQPVVPPRDMAYIESRLKSDPQDSGALWRQKRTQGPAQPAGTGAFAPPQQATMSDMEKADILEQAAKAIQAGKDPEAVKKRLQEMGIKY